MTAFDYLKAFLFALLIMAVNVAISFVVVGVYAWLIEPGHDDAYYQAAAQDIAPWSSVVFGFILFYIAAWITSRRNPERPAMTFAMAMVASYFIVDLAVMIGAGALPGMLAIFILSMATKALGAWLGVRKGQAAAAG